MIDPARGIVKSACVALCTAWLLAGCGLFGGDQPEQASEKHDSRLVRTLRAAKAAMDAFDGTSGTGQGTDPATQGATTDAEDISSLAGLGAVLETFGSGPAVGAGPAEGGQPLDRESIAEMAAQMDEELRRMKASGDLSGAGDVMRRMMEMTNAMQNGEATGESAVSAPSAASAGSSAAATSPASGSDEMRALGGIPVGNDPLSQEQRLRLFAPQALEGTP